MERWLEAGLFQLPDVLPEPVFSNRGVKKIEIRVCPESCLVIVSLQGLTKCIGAGFCELESDFFEFS